MENDQIPTSAPYESQSTALGVPPTMPTTPSMPVSATPPPKKRAGKKVMIFLLVLLLMVASAAGAYYVAKNKKASVQPTTATNTTATQTTKKAEPAVVSDTYAGYPLNVPKKMFKTTMVMPSGYSLVATWPSTTTQGELNGYYVTAFNDFMGYWLVNTAGTVQSPSTSNTSNFSVVDVTNWAKTQDPANTFYPSEAGPQTTYTLKQKQTFVSSLKTDTAACAKDPSKGFQTKDSVFNVCYDLLKPGAEGADWTISIKGYGEVDSVPLYLTGSMSLPSSGKDSKNPPTNIAETYTTAFKQIAVVSVDRPAN